MITVAINHEKETVTYSTRINVEGKLLLLSITKLLYYAKPHQLNHSLPLPQDLIDSKITLFENIFYFPIEYYTSKKRGHYVHCDIVESNYIYNSGLLYERQWSIV